MKVRAKFAAANKFGVYKGERRYNHSKEFDVDDPKDFSEVWMVKLEEPKPRKTKPKAESNAGDGAE